MMSDLAKKALEIATSQIGEEEKPRGSNWGHPVKDYLSSVGLDFPASWCMAFIHWCFNEAADHLEVDNPLVKTGGVLNAYNRAFLYRKTEPQPGDIFIQDHGHGLGHAGIIESIEGDVLNTIEGNTNDTGSREGFEVCRRTRSKESMKGYLRY